MQTTLHEELLKDNTQYCCYCGSDRMWKFSCCGEVHFETYAEMCEEDQKQFESNSQ